MLFAYRRFGPLAIHKTHSDDSDQAERMPRLMESSLSAQVFSLCMPSFGSDIKMKYTCKLLISLILFLQANTYVDEMNMTEAERANRTARNLVIASVVIGVCWIILVIILRLVVFTTQYAIVYS